jgi:hypothetical protein
MQYRTHVETNECFLTWPKNCVMLTNKMHFLKWFNSVLLVFYMFRKSDVHHQEDCIVHAALHVIFSMHLCKQFTILQSGKLLA